MRALMVLLFSSPKRNMKKKKSSFSFLHIPACPPQLFTGYLYLKHQVRGGLIIIIFFLTLHHHYRKSTTGQTQRCVPLAAQQSRSHCNTTCGKPQGQRPAVIFLLNVTLPTTSISKQRQVLHDQGLQSAEQSEGWRLLEL